MIITPNGDDPAKGDAKSDPVSKDELLAQAVQELNSAILALRTLIKKEYPNRREIEARFVLKARSSFVLRTLLTAIVVAAILSFFATVTTVSQCFLGTSDGHPDACGALPGYDQTMTEQEESKDRLARILRRTDRRLAEMESRLRIGER